MENNCLFYTAAAFLAMFSGILLIMRYRSRCRKMRVYELTEYLERVNFGAEGTMIQMKEDEFSHLQDEIYKTVTSLRQMKEEAVTARMNFADNLANIAHQLKTPITASFLLLQLMEQNAPNDYVQQIKNQLMRLNELEESLLTLSRIDAGTLPLEHSQVDVFTVLNLAAENLSELFMEKQISVSIPDHGCAEMNGDMEWTMEAIMNLMKNCMEHSPEGGCICCEYSQNPL